MKRRLIALLLVFALLCPLLAVGAAADYTVYITDTGEKYHNYGCRYLSESWQTDIRKLCQSNGIYAVLGLQCAGSRA